MVQPFTPYIVPATAAAAIRPAHEAGAPTDRYEALLALPDAALEDALAGVAREEHALPEPQRYEAALGRLRAWLRLDGEDVRIVARSFERVLAGLPREYAARNRETELAVVMNGMRFDEFRALVALRPWMREYTDAALEAAELAAAARRVA